MPESAIREIERIIREGNKAETEYGRDGYKVIEVKRKVQYRERP